MLLAPEDSALFGKISECMKGLFDVEDVKSDPDYTSATDTAVMMIAGYRANIARNKDNEKFIRDSFAEEASAEKLRNEISQIKHEISHNNLDDISSEWIKEWHEKRQRNINKDAKTEEIRDFITGSLNQEESRAEIRSDGRKRRRSSKSLITWCTSLAAAAIIGAVFLIRSLLPSGNTQKLFSKYYEPFNAVSDITRGISSGGSISFNRAIENYKSGDYLAAETGFSKAILNETLSFSASFFLGITEIQLGNYPGAIDLLGGVASRQGEYTKEARWYLGLAYLKSGNRLKASECFELLARSPGFYKERSEKILRHLR
jgi:TolA-binding protein